MKSTTQKITLLAVGIALFVALSMCLQVPVFENYYLCLGYVVMAVYCYSFGTVSGTAAGTLGVVLYCLVINGLRGMPGWALGNIVIGNCFEHSSHCAGYSAWNPGGEIRDGEYPLWTAFCCSRGEKHLCLCG